MGVGAEGGAGRTAPGGVRGAEQSGDLRQAGFESVDFRLCENLDAMITEQGGRDAGTPMFPAAEAPIIDKAASAGGASIDQQSKPATVLAGERQSSVRTLDVESRHIGAGRL